MYLTPMESPSLRGKQHSQSPPPLSPLSVGVSPQSPRSPQSPFPSTDKSAGGIKDLIAKVATAGVSSADELKKEMENKEDEEKKRLEVFN